VALKEIEELLEKDKEFLEIMESCREYLLKRWRLNAEMVGMDRNY